MYYKIHFAFFLYQYLPIKVVQVSRGCREDKMSLRTGGVAVAVNASKGTYWREGGGVRRIKRQYN